jgi:Tol biopolymer transport system component
MDVCALLEARGVSCWIAPRDVAAGKVWDEAILDAIEGASAFLLMLSSSANASAFVKNEVNRAFSLNKPIVTFRIEDVGPGRSLELYLARHHWTDGFGGHLETQVNQLASSVIALVGAVPVAGVVATRASAKSAAKLKTAARLTLRERIAWVVASLALIGLAAIAIPSMRGSLAAPAASREMRLHLVLPQDPASFGFALSPDGSTVAFEAGNTLWIRRLETDSAEAVPGTEDRNVSGLQPFWSPDSKSIGFFGDGKLKRLDLATASVRTIADLPGFAGDGGTWSRDGVIVFASSSDASPLYRVPAAGGTPVAATKLAADDRTQRNPQFLPDGRHFVFFARTTTSHGIYAGSLDSPDTKRLLDSDGKAIVVPPDLLLFARNGALLAQHVNLADMTARGEPVPVTGQVAQEIQTRNTSEGSDVAVSAASDGTVLYQTGGQLVPIVLQDSSGRDVAPLVDDVLFQQAMRASVFAPDGRTIAVGRVESGNADIWLVDLARTIPPRRLTSDPAFDGMPVWSPDGRQIAYASNRKGVLDLYVKSVNADDEHVLLESPLGKAPLDWSRDGRFILFQQAGPSTADDVWALPLFGDHKPFVIAQTPFLECCGRFSPDGRWVAYSSWETGRPELYVQPFPGTTGRIRVSMDGGGYPTWRSDGRELIYNDIKGNAVRVAVSEAGGALTFGAPERLFDHPGIASPDGRVFLGIGRMAPRSPITVLLGWKPR